MRRWRRRSKRSTAPAPSPGQLVHLRRRRHGTALGRPPHFQLFGNTDANDQVRVDVIDPAAAIDSLAEEDVFGTLFQNEDSDPVYMGPTDVSLDLTPF